MQGWFHGHGVFQTAAAAGGMKFEGERESLEWCGYRRSRRQQQMNVILEGEFRGGRVWGHGMLTFDGGRAVSEGYFQVSEPCRAVFAQTEAGSLPPNPTHTSQDSRVARDCCAGEDVRKARTMARFAR